jgi:DNA primase
MTSAEILEEVRESIRVEDITEFEGLPAGPRVADSDAIVVVEGRADVLTLLRYGIKNAVAVEGTNVPDPVAELTQERTVTAFLDGDRGGELILRELAQVGDVDYVAFAPANRSVEELGRREVMRALREKVPYDTLPHEGSARAAVHASTGTAEGPTDPPQESQGTTESAATPASEADDASDTGDSEDNQADDGLVPADATAGAETDGAGAAVESASAGVDAAPSEDGDQTTESQEAVTADEWADGDTTAVSDAGDDGVTETETDDEQSTQAQTDAATDEEIAAERASTPDGDDASTLRDHVRAVIEGETGTARLLDDEFDVVEAVDAEDVFEAIRTADAAPYAVVLDDVLSQRVLDVAAQRGVEHVVVRETDEFVKQPVDVRVRTVSELVVE